MKYGVRADKGQSVFFLSVIKMGGRSRGSSGGLLEPPPHPPFLNIL